MNLFSSKTVLAALAAAVLSVATPAGAQTPNIRVDVPFSFVAGDQLLRAGEYRIDVDNARHMFRITSADDGSVSYVRILPVTTRRSSQEADRRGGPFCKARASSTFSRESGREAQSRAIRCAFAPGHGVREGRPGPRHRGRLAINRRHPHSPCDGALSHGRQSSISLRSSRNRGRSRNECRLLSCSYHPSAVDPSAPLLPSCSSAASASPSSAKTHPTL